MVKGLIAIFVTSFAVGFSGAMMPGPVSAATVSESARRGFRAGPLITAGHAIAEVAIVVALVSGASELLRQRLIASIIGICGGAFLFWMGYEMVISAWRGEISLSPKGERPKGMARFGLIPAGVLTSLANPYWFIWWATIGASYILFSLDYGAAGPMAFYCGHILSDLSWNSLLAFAISFKRKVMSDRFYRGVIFVCGLFLIAMSVLFFYKVLILNFKFCVCIKRFWIKGGK
jgi:threonine/homoserine/homoserine lactone efflux protein